MQTCLTYIPWVGVTLTRAMERFTHNYGYGVSDRRYLKKSFKDKPSTIPVMP